MITSEMKSMLLKSQMIEDLEHIKKEMEDIREELNLLKTQLLFAIRESRIGVDL